jgi:uncharacterized OsmC-like protein
MGDIQTTYSAEQNCTAFKKSHAKSVSMDCPYTGKGEEFSPTNMVEAALGGCMLLAMGTLAMRNRLDISGTRIEVDIAVTDKPVMRFKAIDIAVMMPKSFSAADRTKLERAAEGCPIKHSFDPDIPITVTYSYPD